MTGAVWSTTARGGKTWSRFRNRAMGRRRQRQRPEPKWLQPLPGHVREEGRPRGAARTRWFGEQPPDKFVEMYNLVYDAQTAAMERVKPGVPCQEIDRAARAVITKGGYGQYFTHRLGHGMGMEGHEPAYMVEGNRRPLEPGFMFSVEPGIYILNEFGVRIEDDFMCTTTGGELLSRRPPRL